MMLLLYWLSQRLRKRRTSAPAAQAPAPARAMAPAAGRTVRALGLVGHQARFELLGFVRNRQARFFTVALPVVFLVVFVGLFGNNTVEPEHVKASTYGVHLPGSTIPGVLLTAVVGAVAFCCLGYALCTAISSADSAQPMLQAIMLPLYFVSAAGGSGIVWNDLGILALWAAIGMAVALRRFAWVPAAAAA